MDAENIQAITVSQQDENFASAKNLGIASLVLGIVALLLCFTGVGSVIGLILSIIGLVLGKKAKSSLPSNQAGMAIAGFVCSIVAICVCVITLAASLVFLGGIAMLLS